MVQSGPMKVLIIETGWEINNVMTKPSTFLGLYSNLGPYSAHTFVLAESFILFWKPLIFEDGTRFEVQ